MRSWRESAPASRSDGYGLYAVEEKATRASSSASSGWRRSSFDAPFTPAIEIGWRLARTAWGEGYASEAARAVVDHAFRPLGLRRPGLLHGGMEPALAARHGEDRHDPRPGGRLPASRRCRADHKLAPHVLYRIDRAGWLAANCKGGTQAALRLRRISAG